MTVFATRMPLRETSGPLKGVRIVEFAGIGPAPFAGMLLADMGADVVRIERADVDSCDPRDLTSRGRHLVSLNLKEAAGCQQARELVDRADVLIEGFRPGVMERLGLGPDVLLARNPRLVYARMTGWGQSGPLAKAAGHDINYIAISGALAAIGPAEGPPTPPLNLVGDYGGGALYLVVGILAALLEARNSGLGQVVDAAMCDGAASLMTQFMTLASMGEWRDQPGSNLLDGGAHFYGTYRCADGRYIAFGAIEEKFYSLFLEKAGITDPAFGRQNDKALWPDLRQRLEAVIATRTQAQWCSLFEGTDACVAPVLPLSEAAAHPHLAARQTFVREDGRLQPAPAPRFSRTASRIQSAPPDWALPVTHILERWR